ncbi:MAG: glycosyl hydrolase [Opitutales bacterium]
MKYNYNRTAGLSALISCLLAPFTAWGFETLSLEKGFKNPPQDARPQVWWHWMYGNITEEGITKDLEQLQALGIAGVTQFHNAWVGRGSKARATPKGPVRFMSSEYQALIQYSLKECHRLGLTMGLQICDGFSQTGGPWVKPEDGMRKLVCESFEVKGAERFQTKLPDKTVRIVAYEGSIKLPRKGKKKRAPTQPIIEPEDPYLKKSNIASAVVPLDGLLDLSDRIQGKELIWEPPAGEWVVLVFHDALHPKKNHPASPEGTGLEANKMSSEAIDLVFDNYVAKLIENAGPLAGETLQHVLIDSWECGYQSWTGNFAEEFKKRRGYDPTPWLPVLAKVPVNSIEASNRFLTDFRVTLDDLVTEEYYGHLQQRLDALGMELHAEVLYGWHQMFGSPIRQYGMVDVPMNEIWIKKQFDGNKHRDLHGRAFTGYAATAGHVYGKPIIKDESFTVGGGEGDFQFVPSDIKSAADFVLCRGTNRFVMHTSVHQPGDQKPGWTHALNGVNFHRGNTWWPYARGFIDYLARCSYMMQQGVFAADVIRYVGHEDTYSEGYGELPIEGLPLGYRADHCDNTVLLERMDVKDGRIVLPNGASYAVLLLADKPTMSPEILEKLAEFVDKGATIIGPKPVHAPGLTNYPQSDAMVKQLADSLWGSGKIRDIPIAQALRELGLQPDFRYEAPKRMSLINFAHRKLPDADIYFIATAGDAASVDCSFRISGQFPQLFDPMTGEVSDIIDFTEKHGRTHIQLDLEDQGSRIIVFRDKPVGKPFLAFEPKSSLAVEGPWQLAFEPARGAPELIRLDRLSSLSEHPDFGVRHFSGVATYRNRFDFSQQSGQRVFLDLGQVHALAVVSVNGQTIDTLWRAPFRLEITDQLAAGLNMLEIKVVNTWVNRLIGDKQVPKEEWICDIVPADPPWYKPKSKLLPSGLLGPVVLQID